MEEPRYRPDIDGLRALAVSLVVLEHTNLLFPGGFIGVDVFFVISGFLITRLILSDHDAGRLTLKGFWVRRIRRILPAALVAVSMTLLAGMILLRPTELGRLGESAIAQQLGIANIYFWAQGGYFDLPSEHKPLLHTWSLAVEEQFYLIWPVILMLFCRRGKAAVAWTIGILAAASLIVSEIVTRTHPTAAFYWMPTRMWELLLGAGILFCPLWAAVVFRRTLLFGWAGLALILVAASTYSSKTSFPGLRALAPCLGTVVIIVAPVACRLSASALLSTPAIVYVGKASYSIYLWHWPLLVFSKMFFGKSFSFAAQTGVVLASLAIGSLSYEFVETPIRSRRWVPGNRRLVRCCAMGALLICATGFSTLTYLDSKYPEVSIASSSDAPGPSSGPAHKVCSIGRHHSQGEYCAILGGTKDGKGAPAFALWGDSHAFRIAKLCDAMARSRGLCGQCLAFPGITPLVGVWNTEYLSREVQLEWNGDVIEWIKNHKVRHVIVVARWDHRVPSALASGRSEYKGRAADAQKACQEAILIRDSRSWSASEADARRVWEEGFRQTISEFESAKTRVWFLMQVPRQEDDPFERSSRGVTKEDYDTQQYEIKRVLKSCDSSMLTVIGPGKDWFDGNGYSLTADRSGRFYLDYNHVNPYGAEKLLSPLLEPVFDKIRDDQIHAGTKRLP